MTQQIKRTSRYGLCPVCMRERPVVNQVMGPHRMWRPNPFAYHGMMVTCRGIGMPALKEEKENDC
jgi:hypothetical protein